MSFLPDPSIPPLPDPNIPPLPDPNDLPIPPLPTPPTPSLSSLVSVFGPELAESLLDGLNISQRLEASLNRSRSELDQIPLALNDTSGIPYQLPFAAVASTRYFHQAFSPYRQQNLTAVWNDRQALEGANMWSQSQDYVGGLVFCGALVWGFFLLWGLILVLLASGGKCCGCKCLGFWSGAPFVRSVPRPRSIPREVTREALEKDMVDKKKNDNVDNGDSSSEVDNVSCLDNLEADVMNVTDHTTNRVNVEQPREQPLEQPLEQHERQINDIIILDVPIAKPLVQNSGDLLRVPPKEQPLAENPSDDGDNKDRSDDGDSSQSFGSNDSDFGNHTLVVNDVDFLQRPDAHQFLYKRHFPQAYDHWGDAWTSRATKTRICFLLSGVLCVMFGMLMVAQGVTELQAGIDTVQDATMDLSLLASTAQTVIQEAVQQVTVSADRLRQLLDDDLDNSPDQADQYCPGDPTLTLQDLEDVVGPNVIPNDVKKFESKLQSLRGDILNILDELDTIQNGLLEDFEDIAQQVADTAEEISSTTSNYNILDWHSLIVLIPYTVFPTLLMTGALLAMFDVSHPGFQCVLNYFVLPIFIAMTIVAFSMASLMLILAGVNADFCLPGGQPDATPDAFVLHTIRILGFDKNSFVYGVSDWYISQCHTQDPFQEMRDYQPMLVEGLGSMDGVLLDVQYLDRLNDLGVFCNRDFALLEPVLLNLFDILQVLLLLLISLLDLAKCGRIIPIYTSLVYRTGCQYSPAAIFWLFSGCLILGFFGMIMITLRSAMKKTTVIWNDEQEEEQDQEIDNNGDAPETTLKHEALEDFRDEYESSEQEECIQAKDQDPATPIHDCTKQGNREETTSETLKARFVTIELESSPKQDTSRAGEDLLAETVLAPQQEQFVPAFVNKEEKTTTD